MTYNKLHSEIVESLRMLDFEELVPDLEKLKALHEAAIKPKPRRAVKPRKPAVMLRLEMTEGQATSVVTFEEKKAEAFLKHKQKERVKRINAFMKQTGLTPPMRYRGSRAYEEDKEKYLEALEAAGLNFELKIEVLK